MRHIRLPATTLLIILAIEFLDELVDGVGSAAWPLVRNDLDLTYIHIGLLLSVPGIFSTFLEPVIGILGDVGYRRLLVVGGGVAFAAAVGSGVHQPGVRRPADRMDHLLSRVGRVRQPVAGVH